MSHPWAEARAALAGALGAQTVPALRLDPGCHLVLAVDTLVAGRHFLDDVDPADLGHKALAVNLSDLAAMGAEPRACQVRLGLARVDSAWLEAFASGLAGLAREHAVTVTDTDLGEAPLAVTVEVSGQVPAGDALVRAGARPGDVVAVTGTLGDAAAIVAADAGRLDVDTATRAVLAPRLHRPQPRVAAGLALRGTARAAIDVSDGLAADLGHVLEASAVGARLEADRLPLSPALAAALPRADALRLALAGGDDYELCFTLPEAAWADTRSRLEALGVPVTRIGVITPEPGLVVEGPDGPVATPTGYDHFAGESCSSGSASC